MERQIKFRFWSTLTERMSPVVNLEAIAVNGNTFKAYLKFCIPLQFTGQIDKFGIELYEGDIVKVVEPVNLFKDDQADIELLNYLAVIEWDDEGFDYNLQGKEICRGLGTPEQKLEKIGNIYENPELMK